MSSENIESVHNSNSNNSKTKFNAISALNLNKYIVKTIYTYYIITDIKILIYKYILILILIQNFYNLDEFFFFYHLKY